MASSGLAALEALKRRLEDGAADALKAWADAVLEAANAEGVVPYQSGALHESGAVSDVETISDGARISISYDTDYARRVHEEPQSARKTGRSKWLETTITGKASDLGPILKAKVGA